MAQGVEHLILIGPRASGKSTVGCALAAAWAIPFVDLDERVRAAFGNGSVREIWARWGEARWRECEARTLEEVLDEPGPQVLALGGGTPMTDSSRERLAREQVRERAIIVHLDVPIEELRRRLATEAGDRPALRGAGVMDEVAQIVAERRPTYLALAKYTVPAAQSPEVVAACVRRLVGRFGAGS